MQTARVAVSNTGTMLLLFGLLRKKIAFFNRSTWAHAAACECQVERHLFFSWRSNVSLEKLIYRCAFQRKLPKKHWRPRTFLLKSDFMGFRFMFVRRVREYARIRAVTSTKTAHRYMIKDIFTRGLAREKRRC